MEGTGTSVADAPQTEEQIQQANNKAELAQMMAINLNGGIVPSPPTDQPPADTPAPQDPPPPVTFEILKEKYGYESPEAAIKEIEELRVLKTAPPKVEPIKYENEVSEKVAKALQAGKLTEVYQALEQQEKLNALASVEVNKDTAEKIIKLSIGIKNPILTPHEIDFQYKNEYVAPKEPVQKTAEEDDDFKERHDEWKEKVEYIETKRVIAAKMAQPELESAKSKIVFPEINAPVQDEGYVQYKKMLEDQPKLDAELMEMYKPFTPESIETKINFKDETNNIDFQFQYKPDAESFTKSVEMAADGNKFMESFVGSDGKFDTKEYLETIHFGKNRHHYLMEAMKQAKNATIKSSLPDNSGGTQRQFPQVQQPSEVDEMMRLHGIKRAS